jgi:hypothetical protein
VTDWHAKGFPFVFEAILWPWTRMRTWTLIFEFGIFGSRSSRLTFFLKGPVEGFPTSLSLAVPRPIR